MEERIEENVNEEESVEASPNSESTIGIGELMGKRAKLEEAIDYVGLMIKNLKDLIICVLVAGVLGLLGLIIIGDYYVALQENRPVDESVITLMKMSLTGMIGIIAGYIGSK